MRQYDLPRYRVFKGDVQEAEVFLNEQAALGYVVRVFTTAFDLAELSQRIFVLLELEKP